jgi:hypothetical protein
MTASIQQYSEYGLLAFASYAIGLTGEPADANKLQLVGFTPDQVDQFVAGGWQVAGEATHGGRLWPPS